MNRLAVKLPGLDLKNPIIPASGTFGYGDSFAKQYDLNQLGSLVIKTTTPKPRVGNAAPQFTTTTDSHLNAVGLKNPGIEVVMAEKLPWLAGHFSELPILGSVAGDSIEEYRDLVGRMSQVPNVHAIELNVSCPNVANGGMAFGVDPKTVQTITEQCVAVSKVPLYVKLSPNVTDISEIAEAAEAGGAAGITMINAILGMRIDIKTGQPILANRTGGLSGHAVKTVAIRMVAEVRKHVSLPIIGVGGVYTAEDAVELLMAGANAIEVGAANYDDPLACPKIISALPVVLDNLGIANITDITEK
ncbi:dihydroorotate dehydrogenase [Pediococcus inopinatus]|uniref:dihydroorotate dehydrogenase n=1 Tax=Pediococcus inopinatus TaxID=114090 RepID=UPI0007C52C32|nr:dihydroorotate dehydrogenase [Pediococcus inopinatus]WPP08967.1 dihydroorotate dehydrogenase [Pediococcus inopinatus]